MQDVVQVSEVNKILNNRYEHFAPEFGCFYAVEDKDGKTCNYARLVSINYANKFPYRCEVIARQAISIDGKVEVPARFGKRRFFNYSGVSKNGEFRLGNLSEEGKIKAGAPLDIDSFNERSQENVFELAKNDDKDEKFMFSVGFFSFSILAALLGFLFSYCALSASSTYAPSFLAASTYFSLLILLVVMVFQFDSIISRICAFIVVSLNICNMFNLIENREMGLFGVIFTSVFLLLSIMCFYSYVKPRCSFNLTRHNVFSVGSFNEFVTGDGKLVVITNKFGDDDDFPMEGYIVVNPEIRDGNTIIRKGERILNKWNYSGDDKEFVDGTGGNRLYNTLKDKEFVLAQFDGRRGIKKCGDEKSRDNDKISSDKQNSFFAKLNFVIKNIWSSKSGKFACFVLAAWAVSFVFGYKLHGFLNYIIPALAVCAAICGAKSKLKM